LKINEGITIPDSELELTAIRSQGPGGQNVNKLATAIHLRFDVKKSSLPDSCKTALLGMQDSRINRDGIIVIKAQRFRSQDKNRLDAIDRLKILILSATRKKRKRIQTKPGKAVVRRRRDDRNRQSQKKDMRKKIL